MESRKGEDHILLEFSTGWRNAGKPYTCLEAEVFAGLGIFQLHEKDYAQGRTITAPQ